MPASRRDEGFGLVDVLIAVAILATTVAGVASLCERAASSRRVARMQTTALVLAADKIEELRGLEWAFDASGTPLSDAGLSPSPADALERNLPGYCDYVDAAGLRAGDGATAPRDAVYARRWSIERLPDDSGDTLVLQVLVLPAAARTAIRGLGAARVAGLRTRKGP